MLFRSMEGYLAMIIKHIEKSIAKKPISLLCLEWDGNAMLDYYKELIVPISDYTHALCKQYGIFFKLQMLIDGEERDKNDFIPKLSAHDKLIIRQKPTSPSVETDLGLTGWDTTDNNENKWYPISFPRLYQYAILGNGDVCCGRPGDKKFIILGKLLDNGMIEWDKQRRMQLLGSPWFEAKHCRQCKHLYLLSSICAEMHNINKNYCCLELNIVTPEKIIIEEFESKEK